MTGLLVDNDRSPVTCYSKAHCSSGPIRHEGIARHDMAEPLLPTYLDQPIHSPIKDQPFDAAVSQSSFVDGWQVRLLPFMSWFVTCLAVAFLALSIFDIVLIRKSIERDTSDDSRTAIQQQIQSEKILLTPAQVSEQSLLILEADALDNRYRQANALLMSRIWTKHLAFITGVILALLGAIFILGKMTESQSQIEGSNGSWRIGITSASPGIILASLGTLLLLVATCAQTTIKVDDRPVYVLPSALSITNAASPVVSTPPPTNIVKPSQTHQ